MTIGLKRYYGLGHLHFITFSCYRRLPLLSTETSRNNFTDALGAIRGRYGFLLVGYVVMPEHVHLLISESEKANPSAVLAVLKQRVARDLLAHRRQAEFPRTMTTASHFWQSRFHDFNVYSSKKVRQKLDYMHMNPVKRQLVQNPCEWMRSSASFYATAISGRIPIDPVS